MKKISVMIVSALACLAVFGEQDCERKYAFHAQLGEVHRAARRNAALAPAAGEFVFADGAVIAVEKGAPELVRLAADDFRDYLEVSMDVSTRVAVGRGGVAVRIDPRLAERTYKVDVSADGVSVSAHDERMAAQALYHLEDMMNLREAPFLSIGSHTRTVKFSPRMSHSGWGIDVFPESYVRLMAHHGFDAILVFVKEAYRTQVAWGDINDIIRTAKKWGLDTYLYSYVRAPVHPDDPKAAQVFRDSYGAIAAEYPGARGYIFVGESCGFPSKDPRTNGKVWPDKPAPGDTRPYPGFYPCSDYPDWLRGVKAAIDAESPGSDIVFWTYNFGSKPKDVRLALLDKLPKDVSLLVTFEMYEDSVKRNGMKSRVWDYSLSDEGPGSYFTSEAERAGELGLRLYTMANTAGRTWDLGVVPYLPCPQQWKRRWDKLNAAHEKYGLVGLMESHHYGWYPSFVTELSKEAFTEGGMPFDEHLRRIAVRDYGEKHAAAAVEAWRLMSDVIRDSYPCPQNLAGPYRVGPGFPYNFFGKRLEFEDFPFSKMSPYRDKFCWTYLNYMEDFAARRDPPVKKVFDVPEMKLEIELLDDMVAKCRAAGAAFDAAADELTGVKAAEARKMSGLCRYMGCCYRTVRNMRRGAIAMVEWENARDESVKSAAKARIFRYARDEYENKLEALPLVRRDSRLGWEPSMDYIGGEDQILWNLHNMERLYGIEPAKGAR
ncbi:MAG: hypothetical protein IJQ65_08265 [Kiritimatiellae bacterium]|nr:hypothetical protein [Kiritimatiellia bacterium]